MKFLLVAMAMLASQVAGQATINLPATGGVAVNWVADANNIDITIVENASGGGYTCFATSYGTPNSPGHNSMDTYCIAAGRLYQGPSSNKAKPQWTDPAGFANTGDLAGTAKNVMTSVTITQNNGQVTTTIRRPQANKYTGAGPIHHQNSNVGRFKDGQMYYEQNKVYTGMSITSNTEAGFQYHSGGIQQYWKTPAQLLRVSALTDRTCVDAKPCKTTDGYTGNPNPTMPPKCKDQNDCTAKECCEYIRPVEIVPTAAPGVTAAPGATASPGPIIPNPNVPIVKQLCSTSVICTEGYIHLPNLTSQKCFAVCNDSDCCQKDENYVAPVDDTNNNNNNNNNPGVVNKIDNNNNNNQQGFNNGAASSFSPSVVTAVLVSVASLVLYC